MPEHPGKNSVARSAQTQSMLLREHATKELLLFKQQLLEQYAQLKARDLSINMVRGLPSVEQIALSTDLDGILKGDYLALNGMDTRNYGGLDGLIEAKRLFAPVLGASAEDLLVAGNSSLALMFEYMNFAHFIGVDGRGSAWSRNDHVYFLCPVPGYDRHFSICQHLGIDMLPVAMTDQGPDMQAVKHRVKSDPRVKGIWCMPKYSNPTGICYSSDTVRQLAELPRLAGKHFRILWDNAYALHDFETEVRVSNLLLEARRAGTQDAVIMFGSSSKMTLPGAAVAFMAASRKSLHNFKKHLRIIMIGPDKINQLRHVRFFRNFDGIKAHMQKHAQILKPKFQLFLDKLAPLAGLGAGDWNRPGGGYYISFNTLPGLAGRVVGLCNNLGVSLTPAGATFPYGADPDDSHIRIGPSYLTLPEVSTAADAFVCSVKLASVEQVLSARQQRSAGGQANG